MSKIEKYLETRLWNCKRKNPEAKLPKTDQLLDELRSYYFVPINNPKISTKFKQKITAARVKVSKKYIAIQKKIDIWSKEYQLPAPLVKQWVLDEHVTDRATVLFVTRIIKDWQQFKDEQKKI